MILVTHGIIGGAVGRFFPQNPLLAFFAGLISHFIFDAVPHWHYPMASINPEASSPNKVFSLNKRLVFDIFIIGLDFISGIILAMVFFREGNYSDYSVLAGSLGGLFPDAAMLLSWVWRQKLVVAFNKFHAFVHTKVYLDSRMILGPSLQVALIITVVFISKAILK